MGVFAIIGVALVLGVCVCVKLWDDEIRRYKHRKAMVNVAMIAGLLLLILGLIGMFVG